MNEHHLRFVLRQYIEHKNPVNLRLHVWVNGIGWLALTTLFSQVPLPLGPPLLGANLGAWFVALSVLYWLVADPLVSLLVLALSAGWAALPYSPWGPGHGVGLGVVLPLSVFTATGLAALYAHIYYHEHAEFMNGDPPARVAFETAHAVVWGAFHFWLEGLLHVGYRPRLKAALDAREEQALRSREGVPWHNWGRTASCAPEQVRVPQSVSELMQIIRDAAAAGRRVRVVGSGFSWSSFVPTDDVLVFCERLDEIEVDTSDPERPRVWAGAGVTNRQINEALARHGLTLPWNVVLENVRIAGIVAMGTHASGRDTATMGDLVEAMEVITSDGELRLLSEATVGPEVMSAARVGLGLFGVMARLQLRVVPIYRVHQIDHRLPVTEVLARLPELVRGHQSVEIYWFAFNRNMWLRTFDRTELPRTAAGHGLAFLALNFAQNFGLVATTKLLQRFARGVIPAALRVGFRCLTFRERVLDLPDALHYRRWIEMVRCGCVEVGFKVDDDFDNVRRAFAMCEELLQAYAKRGLYPMDLTLNVRFTGASGALLSAAYGEGLTCYIEALCVGRAPGWAELSVDLCAAWMRIPGALPHLAKEFERVPGIGELLRERLGERRRRFLAAWEESGVDRRRMFVNPLIERLLLDEGEEEQAPSRERPVGDRAAGEGLCTQFDPAVLNER